MTTTPIRPTVAPSRCDGPMPVSGHTIIPSDTVPATPPFSAPAVVSSSMSSSAPVPAALTLLSTPQRTKRDRTEPPPLRKRAHRERSATYRFPPKALDFSTIPVEIVTREESRVTRAARIEIHTIVVRSFHSLQSQ